MQRNRRAAMVLAAVVSLTVAACSGGGAPSGETATAPSDPEKVSGDITVLTNRTDLVQDGTMERYADAFNELYPKVNVKFEDITDYEGEVKIRMNTEDYGDVLLIPAAISKSDYPKFFAPLGETKEMSEKYRFTDKADVGGKTYGLATFGTANGILYNKSVWKKAGITDWPTTPQDFIADLKAVKAKTSAVPYYTNFKDGWPLTTPWTNSVGSVSCDVHAFDKLAEAKAPWKKGGELNILDSLLYDIVDSGLSEKDPSTTNWESSKTMLAKGEVGSMVLGSWAITQVNAAAKKAGQDPADIGFMPIPVQQNGKFCSTLTSDYQQAVNIHSDHKEAARAWVDWFTEKSGYDKKEGAVSAVQEAELPKTLDPFLDRDVKIMERSEKRTEQVNAIDDAAEIGLSEQDYRRKLIDIARGSVSGSAESYFSELDERWAEASETVG